MSGFRKTINLCRISQNNTYLTIKFYHFFVLQIQFNLQKKKAQTYKKILFSYSMKNINKHKA